MHFKLNALKHTVFTQRAFFALILLILTGCSTSTCRQWEIQEITTKNPCFNAGRLILGPDSDYSYLELELARNSSGIRFYINLLLLAAPPWQEDPTRTSMTLQFENQEPWVIHPYLLEGGQRLLIPGEIADILVQALLEERCFTLQIGRNQMSVVPTHFMKTYECLLKIPIEETVSDENFLGP